MAKLSEEKARRAANRRRKAALAAPEREAYEAAEAEFRRRHADCHAIRWSVSGSRTAHCGFCCPPPPLSEQQLEAIAKLLVGVGRPDPAELDTWRLTLTCDHVIDKTQHSSNTYWSGLTTHCSTCGQTRGIVASEKLPPSHARRAAEQRRLAVQLDEARLS